jgi:hypothetical protein
MTLQVGAKSALARNHAKITNVPRIAVVKLTFLTMKMELPFLCLCAVNTSNQVDARNLTRPQKSAQESVMTTLTVVVNTNVALPDAHQFVQLPKTIDDDLQFDHHPQHIQPKNLVRLNLSMSMRNIFGRLLVKAALLLFVALLLASHHQQSHGDAVAWRLLLNLSAF